MRKITDLKDLRGKRVLLRADFNVPINNNGEVEDIFRIEKTLPTINFLREAGAKTIIVSHFGSKESKSLKPVYLYLEKNFPVTFLEHPYSGANDPELSQMSNGDVVLLENLRFNDGEKNNDEKFAKFLASLADIYVNDAFSASHREHASIVGVPKHISGYAGILFIEEVDNLSKAFHPTRPFLFVLGGAKFDTKLPLIKKFIPLVDNIFVGGALANNFFKETGKSVGRSLVSEGDFDLKELIGNKKIILPTDVVVKNGEEISTKTPDQILPEDFIWDAGEKSIDEIKKILFESKFVLWNGPLGNFEIGFKQGTLNLAKIIAESDVESIVGGGDTLAAIKELGLYNKFSFVSTGGGAMLDFLANEMLPGIEVLNS
ncbi:MAG: phosphoglycerate kinase [Parcubacteria group bacterium]|nr:phosphoglycerate kinase [Parcubacteria group bacterium]